VADPRFVVNASPLIFLAAVDVLSLLPQLASEVLIPAAVLAEVLAAKEPRAALQSLPTTPWARIEPASPVPSEIAGWDLGAGETHVLTVALTRPGAEVVIDDLQARRCAQALGLPKTGTLGVILRAKQRGLIPAARPLVEALRLHRFFLAHELLEATLAEVGE
jgi:predicted nucleic acid-binding protein